MDAIVLAGGFGSRLKNMVPGMPKPMAPVAGRPFLEIVLSSLARKGFHRVVLSLGYMAGVIVEHFGTSFCGMELNYEIEDQPLGTGGALRAALPLCQSDHVFVFNGDTFLDIEADAVEALWQRERCPIVIGCRVPDTRRFGRVEVANGIVVSFTEKGLSGPGLINAGCYVLPVNALNAFQLGSAFSLEIDYFARIVSEKSVAIFESNGAFIDIGVPEDYRRAQTELVAWSR